MRYRYVPGSRAKHRLLLVVSDLEDTKGFSTDVLSAECENGLGEHWSTRIGPASGKGILVGWRRVAAKPRGVSCTPRREKCAMHTGTFADDLLGDWAMLAVALLYLCVGFELLRHTARAVTVFVHNLRHSRHWSNGVFREVDDDALPKRVAAKLNRQTSEMLELGFEPVGQYRQQTIGSSGYRRLFRSADGAVLGDLFYSEGLAGAGFICQLDDGFYLGVSTHKIGDDSHVTVTDAADTAAVQFWSVFGGSLRRTYECFVTRQAACQQQHGAAVRPLPSGELPQWLNDLRRLVARESVGSVRLDPPMPSKVNSAIAGS